MYRLKNSCAPFNFVFSAYENPNKKPNVQHVTPHSIDQCKCTPCLALSPPSTTVAPYANSLDLDVKCISMKWLLWLLIVNAGCKHSRADKQILLRFKVQ